MPLVIDVPPTDEAISLEQYLAAIEEQRYDFKQRDHLIDSAQFLRKLYNNRCFMLDKVFGELKDIVDFQRSNYYGPQVFMLYVTSDYFLRANVWRPLSALEKGMKDFKYDVCHDHNFDILTCGYFGPGYVSRTYTYSHDDVTGVLGERLPLSESKLFTLHEGCIALYRAKHDVHIQLPPEELSVSLNLIPKNESLRELQYQVDETSGRICRYLQSSGSELVIRLAGVLCSEAYLEPLAIIAKGNPSPKLQALATVSYLRISGEPEFSDTQSALVQDLVRREHLAYGSCLKQQAC